MILLLSIRFHFFFNHFPQILFLSPFSKAQRNSSNPIFFSKIFLSKMYKVLTGWYNPEFAYLVEPIILEISRLSSSKRYLQSFNHTFTRINIFRSFYFNRRITGHIKTVSKYFPFLPKLIFFSLIYRKILKFSLYGIDRKRPSGDHSQSCFFFSRPNPFFPPLPKYNIFLTLAAG